MIANQTSLLSFAVSGPDTFLWLLQSCLPCLSVEVLQQQQPLLANYQHGRLQPPFQMPHPHHVLMLQTCLGQPLLDGLLLYACRQPDTVSLLPQSLIKHQNVQLFIVLSVTPDIHR